MPPSIEVKDGLSEVQPRQEEGEGEEMLIGTKDWDSKSYFHQPLPEFQDDDRASGEVIGVPQQGVTIAYSFNEVSGGIT